MNNSLIGLMRHTTLFMKTTAISTLIVFGTLVFSPSALAMRSAVDATPAITVDNNPEAQLSSLLEQITQQFDALEVAHEAGQDTAAIVSRLNDLQTQMIDLDSQVMTRFEQMGQQLKDKQLSDTILQRHRDMVTHYKAHRAKIIEQFEDKDMTHWRWLLGHWWTRLLSWLGLEVEELVATPYKNIDPKKFKRSQQAFDPNNLPNKSLRPDKNNKPKRTKHDYTQAALFNTPKVQLTALGDFTFDQLPGASDPVYLAETDEVLLTQPIKDQAALLNYDPVKIYHWVRNNIEWQPTWGAIQDAELTLDARRGNAMDIASLTVALLRASQIPARYVHGTIDVPIEQFNNWAGGFTSSDAAVDFAASGGIPTAAMISGGKIDEARLEHVWVEAAIDYFPSRGAINKDADSWVQMDPSYKQYEYLTGLDAVQISGIDTQQLANDFLASGTINEAEGWISGFDPTILENAQTQAQTALENHITNNLPNPTVEDVIGGRKTIIQEYPALPSSLPNRIIVEGARYDRLPSQLQQEVSYTLGRNSLGQPIGQGFAYATLNNEKVTLSFRSATPDDEAALLALLPEGEITDISQLPTSISSYLIEVIPELKVNGELKISGEPMRLGEELVFNTRIKFVGRSANENYDYKVIAGSYLSVNVVAGNVSQKKITELQANLEATKVKLKSNDEAQISSLTRQELQGDMFYAGSLSYFSQLNALTKISASSNNAHYQLAAGYGTFGYEPKVNYIFGVPIEIRTGSITLDIPISIVTANTEGNKEDKRSFVLQTGALSSILENTTPEQMFYEPVNPADAISAVKALQKAREQGQRIYLITQSNIDNIMPNLNLGVGTEQEIVASVNAGLEVITHTDLVSVPGYTGEGYIIIDPETGSGAYKIGGGGNGAVLLLSYLGHLAQVASTHVIAVKSLALSEEFTRRAEAAVDYLLCLINNIKAIAVAALDIVVVWKGRENILNGTFRSIFSKAVRRLALRAALVGGIIVLLDALASCLPPQASIKHSRKIKNEYV